LKSVEITVLGAGASLIGGSLKSEIPARGSAGAGAWWFSSDHRARDAPKEEKRSLSASWACPT